MDVEKLKALMAQKKQSMRRVDRAAGFKPGKNRIRIAAGWRDGEEEVWFRDFGQHFIKDAADQIQAVYVCVDATYGKPCKVCNTLKAAMKGTVDDQTAKILAKAAVGKVILINAYHLDSDEPNTPKVTAVKSKLFTQLIEILETAGPERFFSLDKGHEIIVTRDGKGLDTSYTATMQMDPGKPIPASSRKQLTDLDEYVKQESDEQERKAIAAVNTVAGFLPAPGGAPSTGPSTLGLPAASSAPIGAMKTSPVSASTPAAATVIDDTALSLDAELDSLLADDASDS